MLAGAALCGFSAGLAAHHSPAAYDLQRGLTFDGEVVNVRWANPHVYIELATLPDDGERIVWQIEVDAPSNMERHGWFRESLVPGEQVTAQVFPGRDPTKAIAKLFGFTKADGTRLSYIDPNFLDLEAPFESSAAGLGGVWAPDPLDEESPAAVLQQQLIQASFGLEADVPLTPEGLRAIQSFADDESPTVDCVPRTAPSITMFSSGLQQIEIGDGVVYLRENWFGTERTVDMNADSHVGAGFSLHGHSIGRWEGEDLVVESERYSRHREGLFNKLPSSRDKRLVERFRLNADRQSLTYSWELTDPVYLTGPVSGESRWTFRPDLRFATVDCSLDSARQFLDD